MYELLHLTDNQLKTKYAVLRLKIAGHELTFLFPLVRQSTISFRRNDWIVEIRKLEDQFQKLETYRSGPPLVLPSVLFIHIFSFVLNTNLSKNNILNHVRDCSRLQQVSSSFNEDVKKFNQSLKSPFNRYIRDVKLHQNKRKIISNENKHRQVAHTRQRKQQCQRPCRCGQRAATRCEYYLCNSCCSGCIRHSTPRFLAEISYC